MDTRTQYTYTIYILSPRWTQLCYMCFDIWPKAHSKGGQKSTVSQIPCLFLFYFFSLHDPATPYPIELDKLIYNWHVVKDISSKLKVISGHHEVLW